MILRRFPRFHLWRGKDNEFRIDVLLLFLSDFRYGIDFTKVVLN